jgi:septum formation protein
MKKGQPTLVLASASPRRQALINHFGLRVAFAPSDESEKIEPGATPLEMVSALALRKARRIAERYPESVVLGADTTVEIDGQTLNKPDDSADAEWMLRLLRGREHHVHTGLAVIGPGGGVHASVTTSAVRMRAFSDHELASYLATGESLDKAGGYGIQGAAGDIVDSVVGCYTNVVGLPLCTVARLLISAGVQLTALAPTCAFRGSRRCPCWPVGE